MKLEGVQASVPKVNVKVKEVVVDVEVVVVVSQYSRNLPCLPLHTDMVQKLFIQH